MWSPVFVPRPGRRQTPGPGRKNKRRGDETVKVQGDAEKRTTTTKRTGLQHEGPRGAEPTAQGQSSGAEGQARATRREAEDEHKPRVANDTSGEEQPDCDTPHACATHGEASEHIGIHTSSNVHPDCVKGTSITCTVNPSRRKGEFSNPRYLRTKAAAALQTNARQPRICTPPGTAATTNHGARKPESPVFLPRPGRRQQPSHGDKTKEPRTYTPPGTAANQHNQNNTNSNG